MSHSVDRSPRRRYRAVTLIEAVLYISIALALIVGGLLFFQQASNAAKTSSLVRQLSATVAETKILFKSQPFAVTTDPLFGTSITSALIAAGAVPADMVAGPAALTNPFGGTTDVQVMNFGNNALIALRLTGIPQSVCARILTSSSGSTMQLTGNTPISDGYLMGGGKSGQLWLRQLHHECLRSRRSVQIRRCRTSGGWRDRNADGVWLFRQCQCHDALLYGLLMPLDRPGTVGGHANRQVSMYFE